MSVFEDKIRRNKSHFDRRSPDINHTERFIGKLDQHFPGQRKTEGNKVYLKIAAGLVLLIATTYFLGSLLNDRGTLGSNTITAIEYTPEFDEVLAYYDDLSLQKINKIDDYVTDSTQAAMLKMEAIRRLEDIDGNMASIEKEFIKNPNNENIKASLVNVKQKKVQVMDDILMQLDFANTTLF